MKKITELSPRLSDLETTKLGLNFRPEGWTIDQIAELPNGPDLLEYLKILKGQAEFRAKRPLIDLDAPAFVPAGYEIKSHKLGGMWQWNPNIILHQTPEQINNWISGEDFLQELADQPVLNANVLDYFLLKNRDLIPSDWSKLRIFFPGTTYTDLESQKVCIRGIYYFDPQFTWVPIMVPLSNGFFSDDVVALTITKYQEFIKNFHHRHI